MANREELLNAIRAASVQLDVDNDDHWTNDGQPALETITHFTGNMRVRRADVIEAVPNLSRDSARAAKASAAPVEAPAEAGPAPEPEPEQAEESGERTREVIEAEMAELEERREDILRAQRNSTTALREVEAELEKLNDELIENFPAPSAAEVAKAYQRAEHERRARAAGVGEMVKKQLKEILEQPM